MSKIILDSGAYTAWTKGTKIDIDKYVAFIQKHKHLFDISVNLDVIGDPEGSWQNWKYLREKGVKVLPVYHNGAPEKYLKRYLKLTDYIGFGAIANLSTRQRKLGLNRIWKEYLQDASGAPKLRVHGLGLTAFKIMNAFPWYSVDSASCIKAASFGKIYLPIDRDQKELNPCTVSDQGRHETNSRMSSLFTLPKILRDRCLELIERNGFQLGDIQGRKLRSRRCRKGEVRNGRIKGFDLGFGVPENTSESEKTPTLSNNYMERYKFNLLIWEQYVNRDPENSIETYHVCSTPTHLKVIKELFDNPNVLISYLHTSSKHMMQEIRELKNK